jgi:hypothetical protein
MIRDPNIKKHPPAKLRWFAQRFREEAALKRQQAEELEMKAVRYVNRAIDLEAE